MTDTTPMNNMGEARKAEVPQTEALKAAWVNLKFIMRVLQAGNEATVKDKADAYWMCKELLELTHAAALSAQESKPVDSRIVTDSLGFELVVEIHVDPLLQSRGTHTTHTDENGVYVGAPHTIKIRSGLSKSELAEVIAHETYHLFYSVRNLITVDEETEAEVFGHLSKRLHIIAAPSVSAQDASPKDG